MKEHNSGKTTAILACDVLELETRRILQEAGWPCGEVVFKEMGRHDYPELLNRELQEAVNQLENRGHDRIVFVYGLCSNSIVNLRAHDAEMVLPRAHDCITLLLGSKERYAEVHKQEPGTYWFSPGWCRGGRVPGPDHFERLEAGYREKFDEEEVEFLMEMEREKYRKYSCAAFTDLGDGPVEEMKEKTRCSAKCLGMRYEYFAGNDGLLKRLLLGPWDEENFLVVPPGKRAQFSADKRIIRCVK